MIHTLNVDPHIDPDDPHIEHLLAQKNLENNDFYTPAK